MGETGQTARVQKNCDHESRGERKDARGDEVKELLGRQVYSSVCWEQSIEKMIADGADTFVEIGPGRTLCGFMRKIDRNVKAINIAKVEDLEKLKEIM